MSTVRLPVGGKYLLKTVVKDAKLSVEGTAVINISEHGVITGILPGKATIKATTGGGAAYVVCDVIVTPKLSMLKRIGIGIGIFIVLAAMYFIFLSPKRPVISTTIVPPAGNVGELYDHTFIASGSTPITWSINRGNLPDGLILNTRTGNISGTPTNAGTSDFTVKVENVVGNYSETFNIAINSIIPPIITTNDQLSAGNVGELYDQALQASGTTPITWSISSGSLPAGLELNTDTGSISGTPTIAGPLNFDVKAENAGGSNNKTFSIVINSTITREDFLGFINIGNGVTIRTEPDPQSPEHPRSSPFVRRGAFVQGVHSQEGADREEWYEILFDGENRGWIRASRVTVREVTQESRNGFINEDNEILRPNPDVWPNPAPNNLPRLQRGDEVRVIGSITSIGDERWLNVSRGNNVGWVRGDLVVATLPPTDTSASGTRVRGVSLSSNEMTIGLDDREYFFERFTPPNPSNKNVAWSSSNPSVATVNDMGRVIPISTGTAVITVKTEDGGYTASGTVTVVPYDGSVRGVSLSPNEMTIGLDDREYFFERFTPPNPSNKNVTWSSSNPSVATVNDMGRVSPISTGTAVITVRTEDGGYTASGTVTVVR